MADKIAELEGRYAKLKSELADSNDIMRSWSEDGNQMQESISRLESENKSLKQILEKLRTDPAAVWVAILRGDLAKPQMVDHYHELKARVEDLESENDLMKSEWPED